MASTRQERAMIYFIMLTAPIVCSLYYCYPIPALPADAPPRCTVPLGLKVLWTNHISPIIAIALPTVVGIVYVLYLLWGGYVWVPRTIARVLKEQRRHRAEMDASIDQQRAANQARFGRESMMSLMRKPDNEVSPDELQRRMELRPLIEKVIFAEMKAARAAAVAAASTPNMHGEEKQVQGGAAAQTGNKRAGSK